MQPTTAPRIFATQAAPQRATPQPVPFEYPTNEDGQIEYQSVIITLDHLSAGRDGNPHIHNKFVFSTQDEVEAIVSLFGYYGEATLGMDPQFIKLAGELYGKDYPVLVYQTNVNSELVLAMDTFLEIINHPDFGDGSVFMGVERVVQMHNRIVTDKLGDAPEGSRLKPWGFELDSVLVEPVPSSLQENDEAE